MFKLTRRLPLLSLFLTFSYPFHTRRIHLLHSSSHFSHAGTNDCDCDVAIIGSGIGGLTCGAILSALYRLNVHIYEGHVHAGGCAHSFPVVSKVSKSKYVFDSGPTIVLGCSSPPFNPLAQVLSALGGSSLIDWVAYDSWGMVTEDGSWPFILGENNFAQGPLLKFGGLDAVNDFLRLRDACAPLCAGAAAIPTMALRGDSYRLLPLLKHLKALQDVLPYSETLNGNFKPFMEEYVHNSWLKSWLDALAFSLSGLDAANTGAATMAYTLFDLHRKGASLDYPRGGFGAVPVALATILKETGGKLFLNKRVQSVLVGEGQAKALRLQDGGIVRAKQGIVCNADVWALPSLLSASGNDLTPQQRYQLIERPEKEVKKTASFMHLHLGIDATGLDRSAMQPHYTVMMNGLHRDPSSGNSPADPCGDRNMVAVSNPSVLDSTLTSSDKKFVIHAYGAGNEPFSDWDGLEYPSGLYSEKKAADSSFLKSAVSRALQISRDELEERLDVQLIGTPLTHRRFLSRTDGTYGATFRDMLPGPVTSLPGLYLCGDSVFPGIGVPAVAVSGANCANTMVSFLRHTWHSWILDQ